MAEAQVKFGYEILVGDDQWGPVGPLPRRERVKLSVRGWVNEARYRLACWIDPYDRGDV